jgi:hypothetical protein
MDSVYYLSTMVLEVLLQSVGGLVYAIPSYTMVEYAAFTQPASRLGNFATYAGIVMVQANVGSIVVQFSALIAPNQDVAFCIAAGREAPSNQHAYVSLSGCRDHVQCASQPRTCLTDTVSSAY